jgi:predicted transcriptional regulator
MKLQFTNGYRPRFDQISRILQYLLAKGHVKKVSRTQIVSELAIPNRQAENLISMMTGFGLVNPRATTLTPLGQAIVKSDPYFERIETLWTLHYIVSSNSDYIVWYRIINEILPVQDTLSVDKISEQYFSDLKIYYSEKTITEKLPKEVGAVLAAYSRSELAKLGLLTESGYGDFEKAKPVEVPDLSFLYCLVHYRDHFSPGSTAISNTDAFRAEHSPGKVLNLPEYQVRAAVERLHYAGLIRIEKLANLDQIRLSDDLTREFVLEKLYGGTNAD